MQLRHLQLHAAVPRSNRRTASTRRSASRSTAPPPAPDENSTRCSAPSDRDQLSRRALRDHFAVVHDGHSLAQPLRFFHVVRRQQDGPARQPELLDQSPRVCRRDCGSSPVVGSSRNRQSGSPTSAQASASRCFCPPERLPTRDRLFSPSCTRPITSSGWLLAEETANKADGLADGQLVGKLRLLKLDAEALPQLARVLVPAQRPAPRPRRNRRTSAPRRSRGWSSCRRRSAPTGQSIPPAVPRGRGLRRPPPAYRPSGDCGPVEQLVRQRRACS